MAKGSEFPRRCYLIATLLMSSLATVAMAAGASPQKADAKPSDKPGENRASEKPAPAPAEKVVLKIADQQVTDAELNVFMRNLNMRGPQAMDQQTRRNAAEQFALMLVLYKQALVDHLEASPDFEREMTQWRRRWLAQNEYQSLAKNIQVTPEEIRQNYSSRLPEFELVKVRQFSVRKRPDTVKEGGAGLSPQDARARLEEIRKAVGAGGEVKKITQDFATTGLFIDQEPRPVRHGQLFAALDKAAFELKDGELSEIVETPGSLQFIQVVGHQRRELNEVSSEIDRQLRQKKLNEALEAMKKTAGIWMDPEYFGPPPGPPAATPTPSPSSSAAPVPQKTPATPAQEQSTPSAPAPAPKSPPAKRPPGL